MSLYFKILQINTILGKFPDSLRYFPTLEIVDFSLNSLTGSIDISASDEIEELLLAAASEDVKNLAPKVLSTLTRLRVLDLSWNRLTGTLSG